MANPKKNTRPKKAVVCPPLAAPNARHWFIVVSPNEHPFNTVARFADKKGAKALSAAVAGSEVWEVHKR